MVRTAGSLALDHRSKSAERSAFPQRLALALERCATATATGADARGCRESDSDLAHAAQADFIGSQISLISRSDIKCPWSAHGSQRTLMRRRPRPLNEDRHRECDHLSRARSVAPLTPCPSSRCSVRSLGTEGRRGDPSLEVPAVDNVYESASSVRDPSHAPQLCRLPRERRQGPSDRAGRARAASASADPGSGDPERALRTRSSAVI